MSGPTESRSHRNAKAGRLANGSANLATASLVVQVSQPAILPISQSARRARSCGVQVWKPTIPPTGKSAVRAGSGSGAHTANVDPWNFPLNRQVGRATPCAPQFSWIHPDGAHGVTRPATDPSPGQLGGKPSLNPVRTRSTASHCGGEDTNAIEYVPTGCTILPLPENNFKNCDTFRPIFPRKGWNENQTSNLRAATEPNGSMLISTTILKTN